jgi:hypothetical protein
LFIYLLYLYASFYLHKFDQYSISLRASFERQLLL